MIHFIIYLILAGHLAQTVPLGWKWAKERNWEAVSDALFHIVGHVTIAILILFLE